MKKPSVDIIAGARPNFMKIAPIIRALRKDNKINFRLIHTGQHYDKNMSQTFFNELNIPEPDFNFGSGSGTQAEQTSKIMISYESLLYDSPTNLCLVVGDVTSTMACSITAKKMNIPVAHVEAGIRSYDLSMPEEINRIVTDSITDYFFTTTKNAGKNLINGGVKKDRIYFVGNTMIDTLYFNINKLKKPEIFDSYNIEKFNYILMTLHRPSNVDDENKFRKLLDQIINSTNNIKIIFPIHPRTRKIFNSLNINNQNLIDCEPMSYLEFIYMIKNSMGVITDSGGITEEATVLGIPCLTLRNSTERPETVNIGTNILVGENLNKIKLEVRRMANKNWKKGGVPELWDGNTAERIVAHINQILL